MTSKEILTSWKKTLEIQIEHNSRWIQYIYKDLEEFKQRLNCIEELEKENEKLRNLLGLGEKNASES